MYVLCLFIQIILWKCLSYASKHTATRGLAQCVKCLWCDLEDLRSDPQHPRKYWVCLCMLSMPTWRGQNRCISRALSPDSLVIVSSRFRERHCLKNNVQSVGGQHPWKLAFYNQVYYTKWLPAYTYVSTGEFPHVCTHNALTTCKIILKMQW